MNEHERRYKLLDLENDVMEWSLTPDRWLKNQQHFDEKPPVGARIVLLEVIGRNCPQGVTAELLTAQGTLCCYATGGNKTVGGCIPIDDDVSLLLTDPPQKVRFKGNAGAVLIRATHEGQTWSVRLEKLPSSLDPDGWDTVCVMPSALPGGATAEDLRIAHQAVCDMLAAAPKEEAILTAEVQAHRKRILGSENADASKPRGGWF
jgi:hypothetical protein